MGWHAKLSASGAPRWMNCPGSVPASAGEPNRSSTAANEGSVAHEVAADCLKGNHDASHYVGYLLSSEGEQFTVDTEMADAVQVYLDHVRKVALNRSPGQLYVEVDLTPHLKKLHPSFGGTADAAYVSESILDVFDYKHGAGVLVDVENNPQLKYYALGVLYAVETPVERVRLHIVQPRHGGAEPVRTWECHPVDLLEFEAELLAAAKLVEADSPPLKAGDHCTFCPVRHKCPELEKRTRELMSKEFDDLDAISPDRLGEAYALLSAVSARVAAIRAFAYEQATQGNPPTGYKLVEKRAMRRYKSDELVLDWLNDHVFDLSEYTKPSKPLSIGILENKLAKEDLALPENLTESVSSGYTIVEESDSRPPAKLASEDDFDDLTTST